MFVHMFFIRNNFIETLGLNLAILRIKINK